MRVTLSQQIASVKREIAKRKNVYPQLVSRGKMRQGEADHENAAMEAVLVTLQEIEKERVP